MMMMSLVMKMKKRQKMNLLQNEHEVAPGLPQPLLQPRGGNGARKMVQPRPPRVQVGSVKLLSLKKRKKGRKRHWLRRRINQEELECLFQLKILNCLKKIQHLKPGLF